MGSLFRTLAGKFRQGEDLSSIQHLRLLLLLGAYWKVGGGSPQRAAERKPNDRRACRVGSLLVTGYDGMFLRVS